jgi:hypothetical protein
MCNFSGESKNIVQQILYCVDVGGGFVFLCAGGFVCLEGNAKINSRCLQWLHSAVIQGSYFILHAKWCGGSLPSCYCFNTVFQSVSTPLQSVSTSLYIVALYFDMYVHTKVLSGNSMNKYTWRTSLIWNSVIWHILLCGMIYRRLQKCLIIVDPVTHFFLTLN